MIVLEKALCLFSFVKMGFFGLWKSSNDRAVRKTKKLDVDTVYLGTHGRVKVPNHRPSARRHVLCGVEAAIEMAECGGARATHRAGGDFDGLAGRGGGKAGHPGLGLDGCVPGCNCAGMRADASGAGDSWSDIHKSDDFASTSRGVVPPPIIDTR